MQQPLLPLLFIALTTFESASAFVVHTSFAPRVKVLPTSAGTSRSATLPPLHALPLPFLPALPHDVFSSLPPLSLAHVQAAGETSFAALALIAAVQGALVMQQYANHPTRFLMAPAGLTIGVEDAAGEKNCQELNFGTVPQAPIGTMKSDGLSKVNNFMVLLLPWLLTQGTSVFMRAGHLMHLGAILGLARLYDFFRKLPELDEGDLNDHAPLLRDQPNVMVIGDSMSVGIGCVDNFDEEKDSTVLKKTEKLDLSPLELNDPPMGPIFPKALARALSRRIHKPVSWRSAGVDGGDATDIREYLLGCVKEEADKGNPPDVVVVLTGANDMKRIISINPSASIRGFRSNLIQLVQDIRKIAPRAKVIFPALPTHRLDSNSCLNVFPLNFFLDSLIGFWDAQKIRVADESPNVYYFGLSAEEVNGWYKEEQAESNVAPTLLSADGIHPNGACYAKWGKSMGNKLADTLEAEAKERGIILQH